VRAAVAILAALIGGALVLPRADLPRPPVFEDATSSSGISFTHRPGRTARRLMPEIMGSGVVIADFNRDGAPDVLLINGGSVGMPRRPAGAQNRLYINDGKGHFRDETELWQLPSVGYGMGAAAGDFDNDGWTDLFLTGYGGAEMLLRNDQGRRFVDVTEKAGIKPDGRWSTSAGFFDLDGDGNLDLYIVRYVDYTLRNALPCFGNQIPVYCTPILYDGVPDRLLRNNGDGTFTDISVESGVAAVKGKGLALLIGDIDLDGRPDLYVANDTSPNILWINDGSGRLRDEALPRGVALSEMGAELAGMGAAMADFDGDGRMDIAVTNFQGESTSLYKQEFPMLFREVSGSAGISRTARNHLGFGIQFFDADNDGWEDLLTANGHVYDNAARVSHGVTFEQQITLHQNLGNGTLRDVTDSAGPAFRERRVGRGLATADLDGDGAMDFIVNSNGGPALVARNVTPHPGNFCVLWLEGRRANRSAIGARVTARIGARTLVRQVFGSSSYLSISDFRIHLGLADATSIDELTIHWPGSHPQILHGLAAGGFYRIVEGDPPERFVPGAVPTGSSRRRARA
jgi:hypothetical protein